MILIDFNQFMLAAIFNAMYTDGLKSDDVLNINGMRHIFLNTIRSNRLKFKKEYGDIVFCCDSPDPWRNDIFPYYKARRKIKKSKSDIDWTVLFNAITMIYEECKEHMPYKTLKITNCEADDIIGTLCHHFGDTEEKILILSRDKDFKQLLKYKNVRQYDQQDKRFLHVDDPVLFLKEQIIRGDSDDDIPNVMSPDNVFVIGSRQKPITQKRLDNLMESLDDEYKANYERNKKLIDLSFVPKTKQAEILNQFNEYQRNPRSKLYSYFTDKKLLNLMDEIGSF